MRACVRDDSHAGHCSTIGAAGFSSPTGAPSPVPTKVPTAVPTAAPTAGPTAVPTAVPMLDDIREAVATLEETERTARRVLGGTHPDTASIEEDLQKARAVLRARETPPPGSA